MICGEWKKGVEKSKNHIFLKLNFIFKPVQLLKFIEPEGITTRFSSIFVMNLGGVGQSLPLFPKNAVLHEFPSFEIFRNSIHHNAVLLNLTARTDPPLNLDFLNTTNLFYQIFSSIPLKTQKGLNLNFLIFFLFLSIVSEAQNENHGLEKKNSKKRIYNTCFHVVKLMEDNESQNRNKVVNTKKFSRR